MGVDAMIYFKAKEGFDFENDLPQGYSIVGADDLGSDGAGLTGF